MATATLENDKVSSSWLDRPLASVFSLDLEKLAYLTLIVLGFITRFYDLGARVMSHDESLHTQFSWYLYEGRGFQHTPMMHGPLKFEVTAFLYWMFGDSDYTARISAALMGVIAIGLMWYYRRWLGRAGALAAALFILISPYQLYYARYIRDEPYVMVWGLLLAFCVFRYMETRQVKFIYGLTAVMALFYATMESSFIYVAIAMVFLGVYFLAEVLINEWPRPELRPSFWTAAGLMAVAALVGVGLFLLNDRLGMAGTAGLAAVPVWPFVLATLVGEIPTAAIYASFGAGLGRVLGGGRRPGILVDGHQITGERDEVVEGLRGAGGLDPFGVFGGCAYKVDRPRSAQKDC